MKGKWSKLLFSLVCRVGKKVKSRGGGGRGALEMWGLAFLHPATAQI